MINLWTASFEWDMSTESRVYSDTVQPGQFAGNWIRSVVITNRGRNGRLSSLSPRDQRVWSHTDTSQGQGHSNLATVICQLSHANGASYTFVSCPFFNRVSRLLNICQEIKEECPLNLLPRCLASSARNLAARNTPHSCYRH